uniref:RING-type domain-containing protein n=1 Tax=Chenopodium quinoa TaxID=63459 RepID=A0A803LRZ0_CHEQI
MDENSKIVIDGGAAKTSTDDSAPTNPNPNSDITTSTNTTTSTNSNSAAVNGGDSVAVDGDGGSDGAGLSRQSSRTPFTNLSQVDADLALARTLQEQDAEEREMAARLLAMAGITEREIVDVEDHRAHRENSQDTWEEVDPDELSYEELIALGDVVGTESRGLSADTIASLPSTNYKCQNNETETDTCVICRLDYEDGDGMTTLPCKHAYHSDCINDWLKINKACPVCSAEVSTSQSS